MFNRRPKKVIHSRNQPRKAPINTTLVVAMALKVFNAPELVIGMVVTVMLALWILFLYDLITFKEIEINLFENDRDNKIQREEISQVAK